MLVVLKGKTSDWNSGDAGSNIPILIVLAFVTTPGKYWDNVSN
jgi:hypothetical protein